MTAPTVAVPVLLGLSALVVGMFTYRRDRFVGLGPVFVAAALAAFAGEHFTAAKSLAAIVPKFLPAPLFIAYFVGVAHLAAGASFAARRYVRWSSLGLALMFALFVLCMDLPGAIAHPAVRIGWSLAVRQATFAIGALALFATVTQSRSPDRSRTIAIVARFWMAGVLVFYGLENVLYPQYSPGVPDMVITPTWVPAATTVAYVTGIVLVASGIAMFLEKYAASAAAACGAFMLLLALAIYVPEFFVATNVPQHVLAFNFVFDTLLFAGTLLQIGGAILETKAPAAETVRMPSSVRP